MRIKLDKLPDRDTEKITFLATAELVVALNDYVEVYRQTYGRNEAIADLFRLC